MDESGEVGLVGTSQGTIWYINWQENATIRLVSGHINNITRLNIQIDDNEVN